MLFVKREINGYCLNPSRMITTPLYQTSFGPTQSVYEVCLLTAIELSNAMLVN